MKVFAAGATGVVGRRLVPAPIHAGHEVVGMTRSPDKAGSLTAEGAVPVVADGLDRDAVVAAVSEARPEVVVHQMTALANIKSMRNFDKEFALTNRLRTEGLDNLIAGAQAAGSRRLIAQSYGNWNYERTGESLKSETDPLDPDPPANQRESLRAIRSLEDAIANAEGIEGLAFRFGNFCGPGTAFDPDGQITAMVRKRQFPVVGDGGGVWSFAHVDDVATATIAALDRGEPGVYNVCGDEPAPVSEWLPGFAEGIGAKPPRHVPVWLGRIASGEVGVSMMTQIRGASNAKAKSTFDWQPAYPSWRESLLDGVTASPTRELGAR